MDSVETLHQDLTESIVTLIKLLPPNLDIFPSPIVEKLVASIDPLIALNMQLEFFFMEESAKINALDPSVSKENFGSLCKIDFVGLNHVLEHIGAAFDGSIGLIEEIHYRATKTDMWGQKWRRCVCIKAMSPFSFK